MLPLKKKEFWKRVFHKHSKSAPQKSNIYLEVIAACHDYSVNFNDLITGTILHIKGNLYNKVPKNGNIFGTFGKKWAIFTWR